MTGTEADGPLLSDEDRTLLERWKSIYFQSSQSSSVSSDEPRSNLSTSDSVDRHNSTPHSSCLPGLPAGNQNEVVNQCLQHQGVNDHFLSNAVHTSLRPHDIQTDCNPTGEMTYTVSGGALNSTQSNPANPTGHASQLMPLMPSEVALHGYLLPAELPPSFTALLAAATDGVVQHVDDCAPLMGRLECLRGRDQDVVEEVVGNPVGLPMYREALHARTLTLLPTATTPLIDNSTVEAGFLCQRELSQSEAVQSQWFCDGRRQTGETKMGELASLLVAPGDVESVSPGPIMNSFVNGEGRRASETQMGELTSLLVAPGSVESPGPILNSFAADSRPSSDDLRVITSRLMKSHVEDLTLRQTPRGSGAGYGVGCHDDILHSPFTACLPTSSSTGQDG